MAPDDRSAILVTVLAAEEAVAHHRERFDPSSTRGVPAHVTVVVPFVSPAAIDATVLHAVAAAVASVPRFSATWESTGWFGTDILWLAPQPADAFRALTAAIVAAFPDHPPYGGAFADVTPHLTLGHGVAKRLLREVEADVLPHLPVRMDVTQASLWCGSDAVGSWHQAATFPLG